MPRWVIPVALVLLVLTVTGLVNGTQPGNELSYSEFVAAVEDGTVDRVSIDPEGRVDGQRGNGDRFTTVVPTAVQDDELLGELEEAGVEVRAEAGGSSTLVLLLVNLLPFALIIGAIWWFSRRARESLGGAGGMMGIGRSRAKEVAVAERPETTFDDVAGYEATKAEVREIVDYLVRPEAYQAIGARGPGGVLLVGPPGTGKTLLARAVAGEAEVPFFSSAGSEFVEMIVGVGASRVRDLFEKARKKAPSIIFIDELDSIGRKRGGGANIGSHNEQEQTLNQILHEMDGFDPAEGVVVIAATNRAEMLDDALTRPGRFDRTITVGLPNQSERLAILTYHAQGMQIAASVDLPLIARGTPGFSGAELRNLLNEAAVLAVRDGRQHVTGTDVDDARTRLVLGQRLDSAILREGERERIAVHEGGHAVVAALSDHADPVTKVTILPSGRALGATEQLPLEEKRLLVVDEMQDMLAVLMGGRVAERLVTGTTSTGGSNDLARATQMATSMVTQYGMSEHLGPIGYDDPSLSGVPPSMRQKPFAEATHREIDTEAARILREAEATAEKLLTGAREALDALVERLLVDDTVTGRVVYELVGRPVPDGAD